MVEAISQWKGAEVSLRAELGRRPAVKEIVKAAAEVRLIHNEMIIAAPSSFMSRSSDTVITSKVKTRILGIMTDNNNDGLRT